MKKSNIILISMVGVAIVALGVGFYVMNKRIQAPQTQSQQNQTSDQTQDQTAQTQPTPTPVVSPVSTVGWKTYTNDKHGFSIQYPPTLKAGAVSANSVLGTYQTPVRGLHVGPLVLIALEDKDLKKQAQDYFNQMYQAAQNPSSQQAPQEGGELGGASCKIDSVTNSNVISIKSVSCTGEGGAARYAYIAGKTYDVFVDGYSKGYDDASNGDITKDSDYVTILSTFIFTKDTASATPTPTPTGGANANQSPVANNAPAATPSVQTFSITADDSGANPNSIAVNKDALVEITFNVASQNVYYGGLDFRSSVVNSGTVSSGQSKTISFKASQSFDFTPYWPASGVAKNYKIHVMVQ